MRHVSNKSSSTALLQQYGLEPGAMCIDSGGKVLRAVVLTHVFTTASFTRIWPGQSTLGISGISAEIELSVLR